MPLDDPDDPPFEVPDSEPSDGVEIVIVHSRFPLGRIVATPAALEVLANVGLEVGQFLARHALADWGDLDNEDIQSNDYALGHGERLLSAYKLSDTERLWIITEWDRSVTTALLPSDY